MKQVYYNTNIKGVAGTNSVYAIVSAMRNHPVRNETARLLLHVYFVQ